MKTDYKIPWEWVKERLIKLERISPSREGVHLRQGSGGQPSEALAQEGASKGAIAIAMDECLEEAKELASPKIAAIERKLSGRKDASLILEGGVELKSPSLAVYMKGADIIYLFLATIGASLEDRASRLMGKGDALQGYLLDRIGSLSVESLAQAAEEALRDSCGKEGLSVSMRFSPGYCDWDVREQLKLNKVIDFSKAGVVLTENCMMSPKKSISAVVGIGPKGMFSGRASPCVICDKRDCDYKRVF